VAGTAVGAGASVAAGAAVGAVVAAGPQAAITNAATANQLKPDKYLLRFMSSPCEIVMILLGRLQILQQVFSKTSNKREATSRFASQTN
jgi:hypothetical protein